MLMQGAELWNSMETKANETKAIWRGGGSQVMLTYVEPISSEQILGCQSLRSQSLGATLVRADAVRANLSKADLSDAHLH